MRRMKHRQGGKWGRCLGWVAALALVPAPAARAEEFYYLLVFGSQRTPREARYAHTFGTFVKATGWGPCGDVYSLEAHTVSWLPRTLEVRVRALRPEPGVNLGLHETIRYALGNGERISLWGPYRIDRELYCLALSQIRLLESGQVRYKAVDTGHHSDRVSNCIHALSSIAEGYRLRVISPAWGETASYAVLRRLLPWVLDGACTYPWVASRLGLDAYPLIRRPLAPPRSGPI